MSKRVYLEAGYDFDDMAEQIVNSFGMASDLSYGDIVDFFSTIDGLIGDWHFTKLVADSFSRELRNAPENKEAW